MQIDEGWIVSSVDWAWNDPLFVVIFDLFGLLIGYYFKIDHYWLLICPYLLIMHRRSIAFDVILVTFPVDTASLNNQVSNTMIWKILPILVQVDNDYTY